MASKGEFGFINIIKKQFDVPPGMIGIGDDCAVVSVGESEFIYSTDLLLESLLKSILIKFLCRTSSSGFVRNTERMYELLFTAPVGIEDLVDFPIYRIGEVVPGNSLIWMENGNAVDFDVQGFNHF